MIFFKSLSSFSSILGLFSLFVIFDNKKIGTKSERWPTLPLRVPSAITSLASEFGMGSGGPSSQKAPRLCTYF